MSTAPPSTPSKAGKAKKEKEKKRSQPPPNERLKIVVRRLPPNLPEDLFWQTVHHWVTDETTSWKVYHTGKLRKKLNKENIPSRAYIAFKTQEQVALFSREFDGHIFKDKNGVESQVVVEFAPYQKVPPEKKKIDNRNGTIEKDEDFISFLESLQASANAEPMSLDELIASSQPPPLPKTTPLLEALKAEKTAAKDKETIIRNHAHYKQVEVVGRKEDKKRAPTAPPAVLPPRPVAEQPVPHPPPSLGKKAAKKAHAQAQAQAQAAAAAVVQAAAVLNSANSKSTPTSATRGPQNPPTPGSSRPPKPPKAARANQQGKTEPPLNAVSPIPPVENSGGNPPAEPSRRTRPVIGIPSRQFEAALSVAGLAASDKRNREKEKETKSPIANNIGTVPSGISPNNEQGNGTSSNTQDTLLKPSSTSLDGVDPEKRNLLPPSPKKEKSKRGGRAGHGCGRGSVAPPVMKIPSILQRPETQKDEGSSPALPVAMQRSGTTSGAEVILSPVVPETLPANNPPSSVPPLAGGSIPPHRGRGRRGGRGGGGGRGRGGPQNAPRGGG